MKDNRDGDENDDRMVKAGEEDQDEVKRGG